MYRVSPGSQEDVALSLAVWTEGWGWEEGYKKVLWFWRWSPPHLLQHSLPSRYICFWCCSLTEHRWAEAGNESTKRDLADPPPALQQPGQPRESRRGWRRSHSNRSPTLAAPPVAATMETTAGSSLTHFYYVPSPQAMWNKTLNRWHSLRNIKLCLCSSFLCCYSQRRITATGFVGVDLAKGKEGDRARLEREKIQRERKKSPGKEWAGG